MLTSLSANTADQTETGTASWYGGKFQGRQTASGEIFDTNLMTAAHKTLPFGTRVKVKNLENGLETTVRINDRGPFIPGRIIDLSRAAAEKLEMVGSGVARVQITVVSSSAAGGQAHKEMPDHGTVIIQIGAYGDQDNALAAKNRLLNSGLEAELERAGSVTRVVIKNVPSTETDSVLLRLRNLGIYDPLVRRVQ